MSKTGAFIAQHDHLFFWHEVGEEEGEGGVGGGVRDPASYYEWALAGQDPDDTLLYPSGQNGEDVLRLVRDAYLWSFTPSGIVSSGSLYILIIALGRAGSGGEERGTSLRG